METDYTEFLKQKHVKVEYTGFEIAPDKINPMLFPFQRDIVRWALRIGRAALFEECGLGKTPQQLEWATHVATHTGKPVLILAPLAVTDQTVKEGEKFGIKVRYCKTKEEMTPEDKVVITNYERLDGFDPSLFGGVVLDESSILKNLGGKTFWKLVRAFEHTPFKLCCTATPAPNDYVEFSNHSTFLGIMHFKEVLARWFTGSTGKVARSSVLKPHGEDDFWYWLTSWAVCLSTPADLGEQYAMPGFDLPKLNLMEHRLSAAQASIDRAQAQGFLLPDTNPSSITLHKVKRESLRDRVAKAVELVSTIPQEESVILWCDTNYEADALMKAFPGAVDVRGSETPEKKEDKLNAFSENKTRMIITKPDIAGFGLNWQHCANMVFIGVSFSFEKTYQALRRSYRFGQTKQVNAHLIYAETEGNVMTVLEQKQKDFLKMQIKMNGAMVKHGLFRDTSAVTLSDVENDVAKGKDWTLYLGDCVEVTKQLEDNSIDFGIHSPPFGQLYIYSDSEADMGNSKDDAEFFDHYEYLIKDMYRATRPGRLCAVHCKDLPAFINRDGAMGLQDFPGEIIRRFEKHGWQYHSRVTIWKDPVIEMERTNNHGLLHRSFAASAEMCRQGMPDYLVVFRKWPVEGGVPVVQERQPGDYIGTKPPEAWEMRPGRRTAEKNYSIAVWQRYASPVWFDIQQTNVLNYEVAKDRKDEKHICPLQLDVISRSIDLWTNPGEVVFSPFAGIGSEGYEAIRLGRKFIGIELKRNYFNLAQKYLKDISAQVAQPTLFDLLEAHEKEKALILEGQPA